jgi:hypothetical protein
MDKKDVFGYNRGFGLDELRDQIVDIIESPEFQQWKLKRQNEEPCPYLGLDDVEEL